MYARNKLARQDIINREHDRRTYRLDSLLVAAFRLNRQRIMHHCIASRCIIASHRIAWPMMPHSISHRIATQRDPIAMHRITSHRHVARRLATYRITSHIKPRNIHTIASPGCEPAITTIAPRSQNVRVSTALQ